MEPLKEIDARVLSFLKRFDFPIQLNGYKYMAFAIQILLDDKSIPNNKIIFAHIADAYSTDIPAIERCFGVLIDNVWENMSEELNFKKRPTTKVFILRCADYIEQTNQNIQKPQDSGLIYNFLKR